MHNSSDDIPGLSSEEISEIVLSILLERHPALVAIDEVTAELPHAGSHQALPDSLINDAIDELVRLNLAHRLDRFTFASHTAVRAEQLR